ncbi:cytochrome c heme lyase subunit CcmF [Klebsiella pneumoniae]|uniref:Cytochrome c heme lyase subunit CcmF n=1 Tax=Klebsiella pneumoniae TaxID=573 RepID=A0A377X7I8_KLEPN|nr:cytochrome c heme lyase subunit CcmF [Klebsiella pneumoniae]
MMPELGNFLLCLAAGLALLLSVYPLWGAARQDRRLMALARPLACGLFACIGGAFLLLVHAFVVNDFTVRYVAENSNSALPVWYRVAATWGAHEGSLLLWVLLLSVWTFAVAIFSRRMPLDAVARVLAVMGMIAFGFLLFILFTSNPFSRGLPQYPIDGRDLNPLLQDIGMIFHPPILYMGYVGFSVAFAFAIASLLAGRLDTAWARWSRPWTQAAWMFLTLGIVLGSAWAYYELGLGRLVVLGPGGKRLVYAVAGGNRAAALPGGDREAGQLPRLGRCCWPSPPSPCACWAPSWCAPGCWFRCMPSPRIRRAGCLFWYC